MPENKVKKNGQLSANFVLLFIIFYGFVLSFTAFFIVRAEQALQMSETNLVHAQEVAHIGSWYLDLEEKNLIWSEENYRIFGIKIGTVIDYARFLEVVHPEDREYVSRKWEEAVVGKPYDIEHRLLVDNKVEWVREKAEIKFDKNNTAISGIGITQDITVRKSAEYDLQLYGEIVTNMA